MAYAAGDLGEPLVEVVVSRWAMISQLRINCSLGHRVRDLIGEKASNRRLAESSN